MKEKFEQIFFGGLPDDPDFKPENNDIFIKMNQANVDVDFCGAHLQDKFSELYEDKYNIDDRIRMNGLDAYGEFFKAVAVELKEREVVLQKLLKRADNDLVREYFGLFFYDSSESDYWKKISWLLSEDKENKFDFLRKFNIDQLREFESNLDLLNINEADFSKRKREKIEQNRKDKQRKDKIERERLGKSLSGYFANNKKLFILVIKALGLKNINTIKQITELSLEKLVAFEKMVEDIENKTRELGGSRFEDEDLIMGFEELNKVV